MAGRRRGVPEARATEPWGSELTGEVLRVIRSLKNSERTMIIVTHEMDFARNVADHVVFIADGVIEEEGTPEEIFGNPQKEKTKAFLSAGVESKG